MMRETARLVRIAAVMFNAILCTASDFISFSTSTHIKKRRFAYAYQVVYSVSPAVK